MAKVRSIGHALTTSDEISEGMVLLNRFLDDIDGPFIFFHGKPSADIGYARQIIKVANRYKPTGARCGIEIAYFNKNHANHDWGGQPEGTPEPSGPFLMIGVMAGRYHLITRLYRDQENKVVYSYALESPSTEKLKSGEMTGVVSAEDMYTYSQLVMELFGGLSISVSEKSEQVFEVKTSGEYVIEVADPLSNTNYNWGTQSVRNLR